MPTVQAKRMAEWTEDSDGDGRRPGQALAKEVAQDDGASAILWDDGHVTLYVKGEDKPTRYKIELPGSD